MSVLDRLLTMDSCKLKIFSYTIDVEKKEGRVDFCKVPKEIKDFKREVYWAPLYPNMVENPWGIKISGITVEGEKI